jgi:hypothetical protein
MKQTATEWLEKHFKTLIQEDKKPLNKNKMKNLIVNGVKFYPIDKDNEIEIEREGWSYWLTIEETKKVIEFLTKQVEQKTK